MSKLLTAIRLLFTQQNEFKETIRFKTIKYLKRRGAFIPDSLYLRIMFRLNVGQWLSLSNPKTFNQKLQWLKLYDRQPLYTKLVDKVAVKEFVQEKIGWQYIIPTLGVYDNVDAIDFGELPDQFVLKTAHGGGYNGVIISTNKAELDIRKTFGKLRKAMQQDIYKYFREWPYKNVKRRIIAEKYLVDESGVDLKDYKFFCFNGVVKICYVAANRGAANQETTFDFFDLDFNHLDFTNGHPTSVERIECPKNFKKMIELAGKLSEGIPHVRVDFYNINGDIYFGEMTFFHHSGMVEFVPDEWDYILGEWITLPAKKTR